MERARIIHYVCITVTAFSLTACVLLIALWVRSYGNRELLYTTPGVVCLSTQGVIMAIRMPVYEIEDGVSFSIPRGQGWQIEPSASNLRFYAKVWSRSFWIIHLPYWFLVLLAAGLTAASWISWSRRFSLRTLLIATTLVAVGLGVVVVST